MLALNLSKKSPLIRMLLFLLLFAALISPLLLIPNQLLQLFLATGILLGLLVFHARQIELANAALYGLSLDRESLLDFMVGLAIGVLAVAAMLGLASVLGLVESVDQGKLAFDATLTLLLLRILLVSIWEEALFRGFLLAQLSMVFAGFLRPRIAIFGAVITSSLLFAAAHSFTDHFSITAFAVLAINGAVWCVPVLITKRLGLSIGLHAAWNFAQLKLFGFAMSGNAAGNAWLTTRMSSATVWTGGSYGPEAGLLGVFGLFVMLLCAVLFCRLAKPGAASRHSDGYRSFD